MSKGNAVKRWRSGNRRNRGRVPRKPHRRPVVEEHGEPDGSAGDEAGRPESQTLEITLEAN